MNSSIAPISITDLTGGVAKKSSSRSEKSGEDFANALNSATTTAQAAQASQQRTQKADKPEAKADDKPADKLDKKSGKAEGKQADKAEPDAKTDKVKKGDDKVADKAEGTEKDADGNVEESEGAEAVPAVGAQVVAAVIDPNVAVVPAVAEPVINGDVVTQAVAAVIAAVTPPTNPATDTAIVAPTPVAADGTAAAPVTDAKAALDPNALLPKIGEGAAAPTDGASAGAAVTDDATASLLDQLTPVTEDETFEVKAPVVDAKTASTVADAAVTKAVGDLAANITRTNDVSQNAATATKLTGQAMQTEPYRQVVNIVAPLKHLSDGDYTMTLKLHPEHLGSVEITVALTGGQVSMQMNADNSSARQILRDSMNELRQSLEQSGLNAGSLDVGSQDRQQQQQGDSGPAARGYANWSNDMDVETTFARFAVATDAAVTSDGPLDVRA